MTASKVRRFLIVGTTSIACTLFSLSWVSRFYSTSDVGYPSLDLTSLRSENRKNIVVAATGYEFTVHGLFPATSTLPTPILLRLHKTTPSREQQQIQTGKEGIPDKADSNGESSSSKTKSKLSELQAKAGRPPSSPTLARRPSFGKSVKVRRRKTGKPPKLYRSYNSSELYNLTKDFKLNVPDLCNSKPTNFSQKGAGLIILVFSAVGNDLARVAVRSTWGGYAVTEGAKLAFLLGNTADQKIQFLVTKEHQAHNDIIQGHYLDHYQNLTLKTVSMMRWLYTHCENKAKFVLKVDDDMFVNMPRLLDALQNWSTYNRTIIGRLAAGWRPHRDKWNKWYVSTSDFAGGVLPNFTTGPSYIFTADAIADLYNASVVNATFLPLEDVFMTGVVAERVAVKRMNHPGFFNRHLSRIKPCFTSLFTSHHYSPGKLVKIWGEMINTKCPTRRPR